LCGNSAFSHDPVEMVQHYAEQKHEPMVAIDRLNAATVTTTEQTSTESEKPASEK